LFLIAALLHFILQNSEGIDNESIQNVERILKENNIDMKSLNVEKLKEMQMVSLDGGNHVERELQVVSFIIAAVVYFFLFGTIDFPVAPSAAPSITLEPTTFTPAPTPLTPKPTVAPSIIRNIIKGIQQLFTLFDNFLVGVLSPFPTDQPSIAPSISLAPSLSPKPSNSPSLAPSLSPSNKPS